MTYLRPVLPILLLLIVVGCSRWTSQRWRRIALLGCAALFLWAWPPFAWLFSGTLEWHYPAAIPSGGTAEAIVVLSGGGWPGNPSQPHPFPALDTYNRCRCAAWLHTHWRPLPVIASGGAWDAVVLSILMRPVLEASGVPAAMIATEERSTSTYENALYTAELLRQRGIRKIVLVTDANHMLRSERSFRKQGLEVAPAPCNFNALTFKWSLANFLPSGKAALINDDVLHEWIGLVWYKLSSKI